MSLKDEPDSSRAFNLAEKEEHLCKGKAKALFEHNMLENLKPGSMEALKEIHRFLFDEIYEFAGEIRTVNLAKGNFAFAPALFLQDSLRAIDGMLQSSFDEIIEKYVELNVAHPFREGNGRAGRLWLDHLLCHKLGQCIDWSKVDKSDYLEAMEQSPMSDSAIKALLKQALTAKIDDFNLYMKGIDQSFWYEGFDRFKTKEL